MGDRNLKNAENPDADDTDDHGRAPHCLIVRVDDRGHLKPSWIDKMGLVAEKNFTTLLGHVFATKEAMAKVPNKVFPFASVTDAN